MMNMLLLDHFYPVAPYRRVQKEERKRRVIVYGFGRSLRSAIGCQREWSNVEEQKWPY